MKFLRDWWRGWSDEDMESVMKKVLERCDKPGAIIPVTERELRAHKETVYQLYVEVGGRQYVSAEYAADQMDGCSKDTIKVIANFVKQFRPDDHELEDAIRGLAK